MRRRNLSRGTDKVVFRSVFFIPWHLVFIAFFQAALNSFPPRWQLTKLPIIRSVIPNFDIETDTRRSTRGRLKCCGGNPSLCVPNYDFVNSYAIDGLTELRPSSLFPATVFPGTIHRAQKLLSSRFSSGKSEGTPGETDEDGETTLVFERGRLGMQMNSEFGPSVVILTLHLFCQTVARCHLGLINI